MLTDPICEERPHRFALSTRERREFMGRSLAGGYPPAGRWLVSCSSWPGERAVVECSGAYQRYEARRAAAVAGCASPSALP